MSCNCNQFVNIGSARLELDVHGNRCSALAVQRIRGHWTGERERIDRNLINGKRNVTISVCVTISIKIIGFLCRFDCTHMATGEHAEWAHLRKLYTRMVCVVWRTTRTSGVRYTVHYTCTDAYKNLTVKYVSLRNDVWRGWNNNRETHTRLLMASASWHLPSEA